MVDWKRTRYLYRGRGLLEVVGPIGRGAAGSGRFRVIEQVWRGGIREECPVTVRFPQIDPSDLSTLASNYLNLTGNR